MWLEYHNINFHDTLSVASCQDFSYLRIIYYFSLLRAFLISNLHCSIYCEIPTFDLMIEFITNIFFINLFLCTLLVFDFCSVVFKMPIHYPLHLPWCQTVLTLFL